MSDKSPQISVLMPVYNAERYLREAVESILNQSFTDFEFLIVNDGSTDGSAAVLMEYAAKDDRIRLISRPNTGYVVALNEMLGLAGGEFLARMDADDAAVSDRFERQVAFLGSNPDHVAVGSRVLLIDPEDEPISPFGKAMLHEEIDQGHLDKCAGSLICHPTVMMRKAAIDSIGAYRINMEPAEDVDLFLRLAEIGKLRILPEILLHYRMHHSSVSMTRRHEQLHVIRRIVSEARQRRGISVAAEGNQIADLDPGWGFDSRHRTWAWWALNAGNVKTARKHAWKAVVSNPMNLHNIRCLACAIRGY